jgi:hypothetical protein
MSVGGLEGGGRGTHDPVTFRVRPFRERPTFRASSSPGVLGVWLNGPRGRRDDGAETILSVNVV